MANLHKVTPPVLQNTIYGGPATPIAYDPNWQYFTNLTKEQVTWFQAQPEWLNFKAWVRIDPPAATINALVSEVTINNALQATAVEK